MVENRRIGWIDMGRGILFIFVIICHSRLATSWLKFIYEPFFLTGFFFLSGYLYKQRQLRENFKSIFNGLLVPFVLYSLIWGTISLVQSKSVVFSLSTVLQNLYGGDSIWFIPCLILVELFYILFQSIFRQKKGNALVIVIALLGFVATTSLGISRGFWCWETAVFGVFFYALGDICKRYIPKLVHGKQDIVVSVFLLIIYIALCLTFGYWGWLNNIDMHLNHYEYRFVFLLLASIGCYSFIRFVRVLPVCSWLEEFGKYTLFLFPFHGLILRNVLKITNKIELSSNFLELILSLTITIFVSFFLARYVYKYLPALGGKKKWWK